MIRSKKKILARVLLALFAAVFVCGTFSFPAFAEEQYNTQCKDDVEQYAGILKNFKWWQEPFRVVSEATVNVGETTFNTVAPGAVKLMTVGFLLWLVIFMMHNLSSLKEVDPMEMLTKVGGMMFKTGFAYCMLINSSFFFGTFVSPIIATAAGFVGINAGAGGGLQSVVSPLEALANDMHDTVAYGQAVGEYAMCLSMWQRLPWPFEDLLEIEGFSDGYPEFEVLASGCVVWVGCWFILAAFPFFLFDAMIRLGVTAALCPLFIVAWVFPITVGFAKKGFQSVLNVAFCFVCLKIILDLDIELILGASGMRSNLVGSKREFMDAIIEGNNFIIVVVCFFYSIMFMLQAGQLANFFADTSFENNTAWKATQYAGQHMNNARKAAGGLIGAGVRKVNQGWDRKAARKVEQGRQQREKDKAAGRTPTAPSKGEMRAERRLRRRGFIDSQGRYKSGMEDLLTNGVRREGKRLAYRNLGKAMDKIGLNPQVNFQKEAEALGKERATLEAQITAGEKLNPNYDKTAEGRKAYNRLFEIDQRQDQMNKDGPKSTKTGKIRDWLQRKEDSKRNMIEDVPNNRWS